jgi:hypothetical protein
MRSIGIGEVWVLDFHGSCLNKQMAANAFFFPIIVRTLLKIALEDCNVTRVWNCYARLTIDSQVIV